MTRPSFLTPLGLAVLLTSPLLMAPNCQDGKDEVTICDSADTGPCDTGTESVADADGDGHNSIASGGDDCDDHDVSTYLGATELCDGVDNDCDDAVDEDNEGDTASVDGDGDGFVACDCDDTNGTIHPGAAEYCDGIDHDCDDIVNEDSSVDGTLWYCDNDGDGRIDCSGDDTYILCGDDPPSVGRCSTSCGLDLSTYEYRTPDVFPHH